MTYVLATAWANAAGARQQRETDVGALRQAAQSLVDAAHRYRLRELTQVELKAALRGYQQAWADYRNTLYRPLGQADARFVEALAAIERDALRRHTEREQVLATLEQFPALLGARLRSQDLPADMTLEAYRGNVQRQDAESLWERWDEAANSYNTARQECLQQVYIDHQRGTGFIRRAGVGQLEQDSETFLEAHRDPSKSRLETYTDEASALVFVLDHLLRTADGLTELRESATSLTQRQADLDRLLFGGSAPALGSLGAKDRLPAR